MIEEPNECESCSNTKETHKIVKYYNMWLCNECIENEKKALILNRNWRAKNYMDTKYCQECIERGFNPPNMATREWQNGLYLCEECFTARLNNLSNIAPASIQATMGKVDNNSPILKQIYEILGIPEKLQLISCAGDVHSSNESFFTVGWNAAINKTEEQLAIEIEQAAAAMFIIKYARIEPNQQHINKLKEEKRKEKQLLGIIDSKETYAKAPRGARVKANEDEKLLKAMNAMRLMQNKDATPLTMDEFQAQKKLAREKDFNKKVGNCPDCGEAQHDGFTCGQAKIMAKMKATSLASNNA